jgi:DNA-binding NtrC family response regulator
VLLDINLPDGSGLDALREIKKRQPQAVVIMITGNVQLEDTIAALRGGAYDFVGKPVNLNELQVTIRNGIEAGKLRKEVNSMRRDLAREFSFDQSSSAGESHPHALTEPDMKLAPHPAPTIQPQV